ncbi:hypothetical protein CPT_Mendera_201 [Stenotrophomonas phage Mendera]|uniref:Uncharacterized protein n=1 Tax=Stenotrophomonas phage Mendera TaxID=2650877 RepID=A0A5P8PJ25_9CAUD|nr:hypothetical protein HWC60_gp214 [Stenotrophomonas phage Mendera]QFR56727.1 hypothetical protein CPT_Mendera_201 [Stenotrophomonas phage Mendera]QXN67277.1 hypothetical protein [Stenotrophomonas phage BUCT608]QYC97414.1 hypothetical protein [Stenotrophomonas phage BUCT608]QYW02716.1 hypothetical protein CPT_Marzo_198 [Stenotrophomonas phage Marzo]
MQELNDQNKVQELTLQEHNFDAQRTELAGKVFTPDMLRRLFGSRKNKSKYSRKKPERKKAPKTYGKNK